MPRSCNCSSRTWCAWKPAPPAWKARGEITQRDLVRNALRMRPDRIIIGEVRGGEAFDMLQAMNTGHDGSMSTIHANTTRDALTRIENMVQMGNMGLPSKAIRTQIVGAVDLIVQVERQRDGGRRVTQVTEVCGMEGDVITLNDIFQFEVLGEGPNGKLFGRYNITRVPPSFAAAAGLFRPRQDVEGSDGGGRPMRDHGLIWLLMIMSCLSLAGLGMSGMLVSKAQKLKAQRAARISAVSSPHVKTQPVFVSAFMRAAPKRNFSASAMATSVFGFDLNKPEHHPMKWWIVLMVTFVAAKIAQSLAGGLVGEISWLGLPVVWIMACRYIFGCGREQAQTLAAAAIPGRAGDDRALGPRGHPGDGSDARRGPRNA